MTSAKASPVTIDVDGQKVSGLLQAPEAARACYVFAHGAGAGMAHPFMHAVSHGLAQRSIATLRYQFLYMERGSKRPDAPKLAHAAVRAAVTAAASHLPGMPLIAGGKSFGGRMTSQAQSIQRLPGVAGLAFLGFPLHPAGKPSDERAQHLSHVKVPMLFLQGTRDTLADLDLLRPVVGRLAGATLVEFEGADHSFNVTSGQGRKTADVLVEVLDAMAQWIERTIAGAAP